MIKLTNEVMTVCKAVFCIHKGQTNLAVLEETLYPFFYINKVPWRSIIGELSLSIDKLFIFGNECRGNQF